MCVCVCRFLSSKLICFGQTIKKIWLSWRDSVIFVWLIVVDGNGVSNQVVTFAVDFVVGAFAGVGRVEMFAALLAFVTLLVPCLHPISNKKKKTNYYWAIRVTQVASSIEWPTITAIYRHRDDQHRREKKFLLNWHWHCLIKSSINPPTSSHRQFRADN